MSKTQNANDLKKLVGKVTKSGKIVMVLAGRHPGINSKEFEEFLKEEKIPSTFTAINSAFADDLNER
ncbi:hypothetical protein V1478_004265 [Vespula squamosa]|uniref:Uncharacterized protein n=1 Tax=Vespula squamosa TaxID=30214 RepID=A0ABD2BHH9_VESSQ